MIDLIEKTVVSALGAASITQKIGEDFICEMRAKYKLSEEEGNVLLDKIQVVGSSVNKKIQQIVEVEVRKVIDKLGLVTKEDYEQLAKKVTELEIDR